MFPVYEPKFEFNQDDLNWVVKVVPASQQIAHDVMTAFHKDVEGKIRHALIEMGWTPPESASSIAKLEAELHAIKYDLMGGEDAPGSASLATVDDCKKEIERLRGIEFSARSLAERFYKFE